MTVDKRPFFWRLRSKLLSILVLVALLPFLFVAILNQVERALVDSLKQNLLLSSQLISLQLESHPEWFDEALLPDQEQFIAKEFMVLGLMQKPGIDGFFDDWQSIEHYRQAPGSKLVGETDKLFLLYASFENGFYLSAKIDDDQLVYGLKKTGLASDQIVISYIDQLGTPRRLFLSPQSAGELEVMRYVDPGFKPDPHYRAALSETDSGFNLEVEFPAYLKPRQIRVTHFDVDKPKQSQAGQIISSNDFELNPLVWPSDSIAQWVDKINLLPGQRVWVLDASHRVLAKQGDLKTIQADQGSFGFFSSELDHKLLATSDRRNAKLRLDSLVIFSALQGKPLSDLEVDPNDRRAIALAATPVKRDQQVIGAVFLEENVAKIQLLRQQTLSQMLIGVGLVFVAIFALSFWYISRLSGRISRLKKRIAKVAEKEGRSPLQAEPQSWHRDELDELSDALVNMGNTLFEYNDYLEQLASRLSHELRTPIAIVRSSLDNLLLNQPDQQARKTLERALQGTERLGEIISRMRHASGVRQAMASAELEQVNISNLVGQIVEGFQYSFPLQRFVFFTNDQTLELAVAPELLAELLDKLFANAMDFSEPDAEISVRLERLKGKVILSVANLGPSIEKKNLKRIFNSLVSIRAQKSTGGPNLGLGLHIVKLIANFHGASVKADNLDNNRGVVFSVIWKNL